MPVEHRHANNVGGHRTVRRAGARRRATIRLRNGPPTSGDPTFNGIILTEAVKQADFSYRSRSRACDFESAFVPEDVAGGAGGGSEGEWEGAGVKSRLDGAGSRGGTIKGGGVGARSGIVAGGGRTFELAGRAEESGAGRWSGSGAGRVGATKCAEGADWSRPVVEAGCWVEPEAGRLAGARFGGREGEAS